MRLNFTVGTPVATKMLKKLKEVHLDGNNELIDQIREMEVKVRKQEKEEVQYTNLTPWQIVQIARNFKRPVLQDYIAMIFTDFIELHGDRCFSDDPAIMGGFARLGKEDIMLIGHSKGKNAKENVQRNFGMAKPEGYRKALRLMKLAEKFNIPVITFINTMGAYPGVDAEERGQAEAIARNLAEMSQLTVPIISLITGEGGSGGALGIGVGDVIIMLSNSIYSVISPEGCASILWRDQKFSSTAAEAMKLTAPELNKLGIIDEIIEEPLGGAHNDPEAMAIAIKKSLEKNVQDLKKSSASKLLKKRFDKYAKIGEFNKIK
jgi:acetyl-CoA carboxylase carboxyl transferase subunit alpha